VVAVMLAIGRLARGHLARLPVLPPQVLLPPLLLHDPDLSCNLGKAPDLTVVLLLIIRLAVHLLVISRRIVPVRPVTRELGIPVSLMRVPGRCFPDR